MKTWNVTGAALAAALAFAVPAQAETVVAAPAAPPAHPAAYMYGKFAEFLAEETGGEMTANVIGPEVVSLPQMKDALQTGLAGVGNSLPLYFAADFPQTGVAGDLALAGRNPHAMGWAMTEWVVNCAPCQEEYKAFGGVFLGSGSSDVYVLMTTKPVNTIEDLQGLRLRSGGAPYSRWAENFGATPVNLPVGQTFEALSQGTIDGTMASIADMLSYRLVDVATNVLRVPLGTYHVTSNFTVAADVWADMSVEQRTQFAKAANRADPQLTDRWGYQMPGEANAAVAEAGIEDTEPSEEFLAASNGFAEQDVQSRIDSNPLAADFAALIEKWDGIVAEVGEDPEALAARAWDEIWSKVDFETYGM
ncbi:MULTISPECIES: TRAP transporter substrate-binding protein DctP [Maritimibacter]|uniref:TRAP-T family transporter, DctP (Periplasmic binding) subunit n=1 Tax=Maritimibacter alkaliphilus HTCC2654 TaxID=314271 RepID=A3VCZ8_9RHOB|nr:MULTISPECIES: TRAP transporter substrate-binding protein DctP [Maritimibacter]EAQ14025.1 TRAP-T family transporter, DctP (periplasmic binding) subunit [Maritimibacter alkaliphilus HTCC2654]MBL6427891.1 TRAP transporter substrate-binding protein DctP [Maritimibacter sp.]TYP84220.1 TRAP-type C4-dicarboxylate transport system substrate-binding protein [Maritimibacter alkaliphilus HTCC2654]